MSKKVVYRVTPTGDDWKLKRDGADRATAIFENKADANARGKELAKESGNGQLVIHGQDGKIQTEHTYGKDPFPREG